MASGVTSNRAPGPRGTWLLGCLGEFRRDPIELMMRITKQHGDVVRLRFGPIVAHVVNHPEFVGQVLEERQQIYDKRTRSVSKMRATCGASLLTEEGPLWLRHRRLIQPALLRQAVERYIPIVAAETMAMLEEWQDAARATRPLDVVAEMMRLTLAIAGRVLFGSDVSGDTLTIKQALTEILADTWRRVENVVDLTTVSPFFHRKTFVNAVGRIDDVVYRIIAKRRLEKGGADDLLSALLEASDPDVEAGLSDRELRDATITMLLAGHETTGNALASTLSLIFRSPAVEERLAGEAREVLRDRPPEREDIDRLEYANMVFAEAIRLYPSIWIMERRVVADDEIGGYAIPAGSMLLISPYVLHRHPRYWDDGERFAPERFSADRIAERPRHAYIPFGAGPHQCIGRFMAPMVARLVVAMVVQRFKLVPVSPENPKLLPGITLQHTGPLSMVPVERNQSGIER
jgi:cytochrome P450